MKISVLRLSDFPDARFSVTLFESTESKYLVRLKEEYYTRLTGKLITPEDLLKKSFDFLLRRENSTSILKEFDLSEINKYFPEYENEISANK